MASKNLFLLFGFFLLLLAIQHQIDALRFLPQQQIQEAQDQMMGNAAMKESFVQQFQTENLPVDNAMYNKPNMIMPESGVEALDANKKSGLACEEKKKKPKCGDKKKEKKKPPCGGEKGEEAITD